MLFYRYVVLVLFIIPGDFRDQGVVGVGVAEQGADGQEDLHSV